MALLVAAVSAAFVVWNHHLLGDGSDFDHLWFAGRVLLTGQEPYDAIGPGRAFDFQWPLLYPMPAVLLATPFSVLSVFAASTLFSTVSMGLLTYHLTRTGYSRLPILLSASVLDALRAAQMSPLLAATWLSPALFWMVAVKPNIGLAFCAATDSRRALTIAAMGGGALVAISFIVNPDWVRHWLFAIKATGHMILPIRAAGGFLLLLALFRWRRLDARLLLAYAMVPHTPVVYDVLPLGLIARTFRESLGFTVLTCTAMLAQVKYVGTSAPLAAGILNGLIYLPCLVAILQRPNEGEVPAWLGIIGSLRQRILAKSSLRIRADR